MNKYSKDNMITELESAILETKNPHSLIAYRFTLQVIKSLNDNVEFTIRSSINALNLGEIVECSTRFHATGNLIQAYATRGQEDIVNALRHEVKAFVNSNRYPNATATPVGFIAVSKYGVYYISKKIALKYWNDDRMHIDSKGGRQWTVSILKTMIDNDNPFFLKYLSEKMLGIVKKEENEEE